MSIVKLLHRYSYGLGEDWVSLRKLLPGHGEAGWPEAGSCCSPRLVLMAAFSHTFILFMRTNQKFQGQHGAVVPPANVLRLFNRRKDTYTMRSLAEQSCVYSCTYRRAPRLCSCVRPSVCPIGELWSGPGHGGSVQDGGQILLHA